MWSLRSAACSRLRRWRHWCSGWGMRRLRVLRCARWRVLRRSRCRMRSAGCGSWTVWKVRARPTRSRWRCVCGGRWTELRWRRRLATWLGVTRACARSSPTRSGFRGSRSWMRRPRGLGLRLRRGGEPPLLGGLSAAAGAGFDLASEPPLRVHVFALGESEHVILLLLHHIAGDGWSLAPLLRDLGRFYEARCRGQSAAVAALPVQYADYTLWQHAVLGSEGHGESAMAR